jgi:hypothetical protein
MAHRARVTGQNAQGFVASRGASPERLRTRTLESRGAFCLNLFLVDSPSLTAFADPCFTGAYNDLCSFAPSSPSFLVERRSGLNAGDVIYALTAAVPEGGAAFFLGLGQPLLEKRGVSADTK